MKKRYLPTLLLAVLLIAAPASSAEKVWQKGTWVQVIVDRPKVVFGGTPSVPNTGVPRSVSGTIEKRIYVIETDTLRLELRQDATLEIPRIAAVVGDPVTFAIEKNAIFIKENDGHEHRMRITKQGPKNKP
jgi:hypothetical protein